MPDPRDPQRPFNSDARLAEPPAPITQSAQNGLDIFSPLLTNAQTWAQQVTQLNASIQREWLSFVDKRLKEDAAFGQSLVACKAPDDIMRVYTSFYRTAVEDYQREFSTLAQLGASITTEAIESAKPNGPLPEAQLAAASGTLEPHTSVRRRESSAAATSH
jgi:Phasin protein